MQCVQESLIGLGPFLTRYLYCITAGRICFSPEIIDSFLMFQSLLGAERHTVSSVIRCSSHHFAGSLQLWADRSRVHAAYIEWPWLVSLSLVNWSHCLIFETFSICYCSIVGVKISKPSSHLKSPFPWFSCRSTATPDEQAKNGAVSDCGGKISVE
jgi:hypothetical protein